ncbi:MAG: hypothetical protein ABI318_17780 [Chthoniobacteraceae bacterium]
MNKLAHSKEPAPLVELLTKDVTADLYKARGEYRDWPAKWVSDSATEAIGAYNGLVFGPVNLKVDGKIDRTETVPPADYAEQQMPRVQRQLCLRRRSLTSECPISSLAICRPGGFH